MSASLSQGARFCWPSAADGMACRCKKSWIGIPENPQLSSGRDFIKSIQILRSRFTQTAILSLSCAAPVCVAVVVQNPQPQADKLASIAPATPNDGRNVAKPAAVELKVPAGFAVSSYAENLPTVRYIIPAA